jgi:hypothetical protein
MYYIYIYNIDTDMCRAVRGRIQHHIVNKPMTTLAESESESNEEMHEAENTPVLKHDNLDWIQPPKEEAKEGVVKLETELDQAVCVCLYLCVHGTWFAEMLCVAENGRDHVSSAMCAFLTLKSGLTHVHMECKHISYEHTFLMHTYFLCTRISHAHVFLMYTYFSCTRISHVHVFLMHTYF